MARTAPGPSTPVAKESFTVAVQNGTYPSHPAHACDHLAEASLVHTVARPSPDCHEASNGSWSSPMRNRVRAAGLAVVAR